MLEPLLYTDVITDQLEEVIASACLHPPSPDCRFTFTKSLRIEYHEKGKDLSYLRLLQACTCQKKSPWDQVGMTRMDGRELAMEQCGDEITDYTSSMGSMTDKGQRDVWMEVVFPRLSTVAVDSIYGDQDGCWRKYEELHLWNPEIAQLAKKDAGSFDEWIRCGNIKHLCLRDAVGPLTIDDISFANAEHPCGRPVDYSRTIHFSKSVNNLALPLGRLITYASDAPLDTDFAAVLESFANEFSGLSEDRYHAAVELSNQGRDVASDVSDIDVYLSASSIDTLAFDLAFGIESAPEINLLKALGGLVPKTGSRRLSEAEQVAVTKHLEEILQTALRARSGREDKVRWHLSQDIKVCKACGSGPPV